MSQYDHADSCKVLRNLGGDMGDPWSEEVAEATIASKQYKKAKENHHLC
jgi:hypothetical protein